MDGRRNVRASDSESTRLHFLPRVVDVGSDELLRAAFDTNQVDMPLGAVVEIEPARVGRPFFIDPTGLPHDALNAFFAGGRMRNRSQETNRKYAFALLGWLKHLDQAHRRWDDATEDDLLDYKFWRLTDEKNPRTITAATWKGDLAALRAFYAWMESRHLNSSTLSLVIADPEQGATPYYDFGSSSGRSKDVKWLSSGAMHRWINVGIHGYTEDGREKARWRPRLQTRDAAFVEGLYGTGLRLAEWSSILLTELPLASKHDHPPATNTSLPEADYRTALLSDSCAKGNRGHPYWIHHIVLDSIAEYCDTERAQAIRKANRDGSYERRMDILLVLDLTEHGTAVVTKLDGSNPRKIKLANLTPAQRLRLMRKTEQGLEPLALWLNEDGMPRPKRAWHRTFIRANDRVAKAGIARLKCTAHVCRHSFALRWYSVGRIIWDAKHKGLDHSFVEDFREQFGDTWKLVQTMMGHSHVETTRDVYGEPFRYLDVQLLLEHGRAALDPNLLHHILEANPRVRVDEGW